MHIYICIYYIYTYIQPGILRADKKLITPSKQYSTTGAERSTHRPTTWCAIAKIGQK